MKIICLLFPFLLSVSFFQSQDTKEIDKKLDESQMLLSEGKFEAFVQVSKEIAESSTKIAYSKGIAMANLRLAMAYSNLGEFEKSISYLKIAEQEEYAQKSDQLMADISRAYGDNNRILGMYDESILNYKKMLLANGDTKVFTHTMAYNNIGVSFSSLNQLDSAYLYHKKAYMLIASPKSTKEKILFSVICSNLGEVWGVRKRYDSAFFYLNKGLLTANETKNPFALRLAIKKMGKYYLSTKEYDSAVVYLKRSVLLAKEAKDIYELKDLYKNIHEAYQLADKEEESNAYLKLYSVVADSVDVAEKKNLQGVVKVANEDDVKDFADKKKGMLVIIIIIGVSLLVVLILAVKRFKKYKVQHQLMTSEKEQLVETIAEVKNQTETTSINLIIDLAKAKDPAFFTKFNELYPGFRERLLKKFPMLNISDLEFCAYLKMNFDTKEIARYADMSVRSVEAKKYRMRKKFGISSTEDINLWVINI